MKKKIINKLKGKKYSIIGIILVFISAELWATNTSKVPLYLLNIMFKHKSYYTILWEIMH